MNKQEMIEWCKSAKYVETTFDDCDGCGNLYETRIFEKDGKYFEVDFLNSKFKEYFDTNKGKYGGYIRDEYCPREVSRSVKMVMVEQVIYTPVKKN